MSVKQYNPRNCEIVSYLEPFWLLSVMAAPMSTPIPKAIEARAKVSW